MTQPGAAELASVFTIQGVRDDAEEFGIPERFQPSEDQVRLACGVITILWGLPLDRRGMSALSPEALEPRAERVVADPSGQPRGHAEVRGHYAHVGDVAAGRERHVIAVAVDAQLRQSLTDRAQRAHTHLRISDA